MHWISLGLASPLLAAAAFVTTVPPTRVPDLGKGRCRRLASATNSLELIGSPIEQSKYNALLEWIKSRDGAEIHPAITIAPSELGGYGVFVSDAVKEGEVLFCIPRSACVTLDQVTADKVSGKVFEKLIEKAGAGGETVALAGFLARERLRSLEHAKVPERVEDSSFGPYLETLPWERGINNQEHTLFWDQAMVENLLPGTMCFDEIVSLRGEVDLAITVLNGIVGSTIREWRGQLPPSNSEGFQWPWEKAAAAAEAKQYEGQTVEQLPEAVKGAFVSILTRAFQDGSDNDSKEKLVPLLDILQHADQPNISHLMNKATGAVEVVARQDLSPDEELMNQYRSELEESMPYHRFFSRFGFVPGINEPCENLLRDKSSIFFAQKAEV